MNAIMVLNVRAGSPLDTDPTSEDLRTAFAEHGISLVVQTASGCEIDAALREAIARRPDALFAAGGDGTISAAAGHLVDTPIPLGVLPLGTLNHFAHDLGLPGDWREAVGVLATSPMREVDVAEVNGRIFINNCSLGSYGEAVRRRDRLRHERGHGKWRAMALASWHVFRNLRRHHFHIETPSGPTALRSPFVLISNNRYTGNVLDSSLRPRLDEGRLWIYSTRARDRRALLRLVFQTLTRDIDDADDLDMREATEATIRVRRGPLPVACDGELVDLAPPLRFRLRPRALRVLAPNPPPAA